MILLFGNKIGQAILGKIKKTSEQLKTKGIIPYLAIILVGDNKLSKIYIREKEKVAKKVGIKIKKYFLPREISEVKLIDLIHKLNADSKITGILIQLPLPKSLDTDKILNSVAPKKDADGLGKNALVSPPTAQAIMGILAEYKIPIQNRHVCLIGYGRLVGKPLVPLLEHKGAKLVICTSKTEDLAQKTKKADIIISAVGHPHLVTKGMIKPKAVIIDAGTATEKAKIKGDVDFREAKDIVSYITPPTGGVGPLTVAKLLENVVKLASEK